MMRTNGILGVGVAGMAAGMLVLTGATAAASDTDVKVAVPMTKKSATLIGFSYCNIHGRWRSEEKLTV